MRTIYEQILAGSGEGVAPGEYLRSRTRDGDRDIPEHSTIPLRTDDSAPRALLMIHLEGDDTEILPGEVWDIHFEALCANETALRVFWWSEIRVSTAAGNNRDGNQLLVARRNFGIMPTFRNGQLSRTCLYRWPSGLSAVANRYVKLVTWATASSASGDLTITDTRGHMSMIRYRDGVVVGS